MPGPRTSSSSARGWYRTPPLYGPRAPLCCTRYPWNTSMRPSSIRTGNDTLRSRHGSRSIWHVPASNPSRAAAVSKWSITSFWALRCLAGAVIKPPVIRRSGAGPGLEAHANILARQLVVAPDNAPSRLHHHYARRQPRTLIQPKPSIAVPLGSSLQYHPPPPSLLSSQHPSLILSSITQPSIVLPPELQTCTAPTTPVPLPTWIKELANDGYL